MMIGGTDWPDQGPTDEEIKIKIARRLSTAISLGGYHSRQACEDVAELIVYLTKKNKEESV
jgi:hypothetical protein